MEKSSHTVESDPSNFELEGYSSVASSDTIQMGDGFNQSQRQFPLRKWQSQSRYFSDQYLEFFNRNNSSDSEEDRDLPTSQTGAVVWTSAEKSRLFRALARCGRHNLPRLANAVETKSSIEVAAYLDTVRMAYLDRQMFMEHPKNLSIAAVPSAIEIGQELQDALDKVADALNAYQEQYDMAIAKKEHGLWWLIDRRIAKQLDVKNDGAEMSNKHEKENIRKAGGDSESATSEDRVTSLEIFDLSTMLDLSEMFFMNHSTNSVYPHWTTIAEPEQRPALTQDAVQTLFDLIVDRLRRTLKIAIHSAYARLSFMTNNDYTAVSKLSKSDVMTALDVLTFSHDSWDFWTGLPRRNQSQVITGSHSKGESRLREVTYDDAEAALASRRGEGGRRRSMSIGSEISSTGSELLENSENQSESDGSNSRTDSDNENAVDEVSTADERSSAEPSSVTDEEEQSEEDDGVSIKRYRSEHLHSDMEDTLADKPRSQDEKKAILDEAHEIYAQQNDRAARIQEEKRLWQILGKRSNDGPVDQDSEIGPRPKTRRKTEEELTDWSCVYMAEWEYFGQVAPFPSSDPGQYELGLESGTSEYDTGG